MRELKSGIFFFGLSLLVVWDALRVDLGTLNHPGPGFLPLCTAAVLAGFSLILIYRGWGVREPGKAHSFRVIVALVSLFVYSLLFDTLGFIVATFLLVGFLFRLGERRPWWAVLGMSVTVTLFTYFIFGILLKIPFPRGLGGI